MKSICCLSGASEAIAWMCSNQLGRRNITAEQKMKLIQEEYGARQKTSGAPLGNSNAIKNNLAKSAKLNHSIERTRFEMAEEHNMTPAAIRKAVEWGRGVDAAEEVKPGFTSEILSGKVKVTKQAVADLRKNPLYNVSVGSMGDMVTGTN